MVGSIRREASAPPRPAGRKQRALPSGTGVLIALSFGLTAWYCLMHLLAWIVHGLA